MSLAVPEEQVFSVNELSDPTPLPFSPDSVRGIISIDGRMFTVLEIANLFDAGESPTRKLVVAFRHAEQLAIAVDSADIKVEVESTEIENSQVALSALVTGTLQRDGEQIRVIDISKLFSSAIRGRDRRRHRF